MNIIRGIIYLLALQLTSASVGSAGTLILQEEFAAGRMSPEWQTHASPGNSITLRDGSAEIAAEVNTYAHLSRPLEADNITASARIKPSSPAGITWCTSVFVVWNGRNWCQMGIISAPDGGRYYAVETENGTTAETYLDVSDLNHWHYVRIELGKDCIRYYASNDGAQWKLLRTIERPAGFSGAPASLVVGKGYGRGAAPYANPELDNDYQDRGPRVTSEIADIRVEETPADRLLLTEDEKTTIIEAGLDPVGKIELRGTADPTFESVAKYYPAMKFPRETVGVPEHPIDISIDHLGRLQLRGDQPPVAWIEVGDPPVPFGDEKSPIRRRLLDGWIPVLTLTTQHDGVEYEQTVLGWTEGFSPDGELFALVRLKARAAKEGKLPQKASLVWESGERRMEWPMQADRSGEAEICLRFPFPRPGEAASIAPDEFEKVLAETKRSWHAAVKDGTRFSVPDRRVDEAYKAWIAYSLLDVDKIDGFCEPHDGAGFYEEVYGYSAALYCITLDLYGTHDRAEKYLDTLLHFQTPDGLYTQNSGLPDHGTFVFALAEHYRFTRDQSWLQRIAGQMIAGCDWIIHQRANAPKTGVTRGLIKFRPYCDYAEPVFDYFGDTYCCLALERSAAALEEIGMTDDARRIGLEGRRYRRDILASMDAAAIRQPDRTILPMEPDTHRLLKDSRSAGDYYGLVASIVQEHEFLPADDVRTHWLTDFMEQKNGILVGLCRFLPGGIDHAYTYGYLLTQLKRGDVRKVLLGFYGMLAYGMTQDTYSPVECTIAVSGANAGTLPHLYSCTQQLRLLRNMLLREDGDSLLIGTGIPRAWLAHGKKVEVTKAHTAFGEVSFGIRSDVRRGRILVTLSPPNRVPPSRIHITLRHPDSRPIRSVLLNGRPWSHFTKDTIDLHKPAGSIVLTVLFDA
jgi:hypothetical protein